MHYNIDGLIFFVSNILLIIYVFFNKKLSLKEKICYSLFFVVLNSSYNIMIKRVHDFNLVIPRTFIYRQKLFGPFTFLDFVCIFIILKNLKYLISKILKEKLIFTVLLKDILIYIVATISFFMNSGYWLDGGSSFLVASKGFVYSLAILILTFKYMNKSLNLVIPFSIILLNGWISTLLISSSELWVRYGNVVSIIDQEDAYTISLFMIILLFVMSFKFNNKKQPLLNVPKFLLFLLFLFQNLYCVYKTNLIFIPLMFIIYFFIINPRLLLIIISAIVPGSCLIFFNQIYSLFTSLAIQTRFGQFSDLLNYMKTLGSSNYFFGIGLGTPYYSTTNTGDLGEIKIIDVGNTAALNYRIYVQTPILSTFKNAGIVGVTILLFFILLIWKKVFSLMSLAVKKYHEIDHYLFCETLALGIFSCVLLINYYTFFGGTLPFVIFPTFCFAKFVLNMNKITMERVDKDENFNC